MRLVLVALAAMTAAAVQLGGHQPTTALSGTIPTMLHSPSRIVWIAADGEQRDVTCSWAAPSEWSCTGLSAGAQGLVVIVGASEDVAAIPVGFGNVVAASIVGAWGRVVRVVPGGAAPDSVHDIQVRAWKPDRPPTRALTRRFSPIEEAAATVVRLTPTTFWVTGGAVDAEAFLRFDGPAIATVRLALSPVTNGPPDIPVFVMADAPATLVGQVVDRHDQSVEHALVELWEPLLSDADRNPELLNTWIRRATTDTDPQGAFSFDRLAVGGYELAAVEAFRGRATSIVKSVAEPVVLRLEPPASASGRVLRRGLPVSDARIRFVPDALALSISFDPRVHLSDETRTGGDGRFTLMLPPSRAGVVQVLTQEGPSVRVGLPAAPKLREIALGDIVVPDTKHVTLRLLDPRSCELVAVGPMGEMGLTTVRVSATPSHVYWMELPEPGTWILNARCGDR
ncbi:MAG: hypothetical protein HY047_18315, partial [Acidobacteria bacterium]|nr:hypothetical protein [Acidobacteriota bacterium]